MLRKGGGKLQTQEGHDEAPIVEEHETYRKKLEEEKARKEREAALEASERATVSEDPSPSLIKPEQRTTADPDSTLTESELKEASHVEKKTHRPTMRTNAPKEGSIGDKLKTDIWKKAEKIEKAVVETEIEMRSAGKELGAEASEAYAKGDYIEAFAKGTAAVSARAGIGIIDAATFPFRPLAWGKTAKALYEGGKQAIEHPEDIPEGITKWAKNIAHDPGSIAEFFGDIATGLAFGEVIKTVRGPTHQVSRLDSVDIDVKSSTLKMVDDADNIMGKPVKTTQFPEAEITPTISTKKIPKIASEIMEAELDDLTGSGQILGVADEGGIVSIDKIDVTESMIDDLSRGKKVTVEGVVEVETVGLGYEAYSYVEEVADPLTGESRLFAREGNTLQLDAKELGSPMELFEDASKLKTLSLEGDELITTSPPDVRSGSVKFKSIWDDTGVKGILDEGRHSYDVKGLIIETTEQVEDIIEDFKPIEPTPGPRTSLNKTFGAGDDALKASEDLILKDITTGTRPIVKVTKTPPASTKGLSTGLGVAPAILDENLPPKSDRTTRRRTGPPRLFEDMGQMSGLYSPPPTVDDSRRKLPNPYFRDPLELKLEEESKKKEEEETVPPVLEELKLGTTPKPKPRPTPPIVIQDPKLDPQPKPPPTIPIIIPILGSVPEPVPPLSIIIQEPKLDTPSKPPPLIQETVTKTAPSPIIYPTYTPGRPRSSPLTRRTRKQRIKKKRVKLPSLGYETRKYKVPRFHDITGQSKQSRAKSTLPRLDYNPDKKRKRKH